jgi:SAM-dependent methyltransferase
MIKAGERILDLGCGTGYLTSRSKKGAKVTGIDASPDMIAKAKESYPEVEFFVADGTNFHFDEKFDAVFSNATLALDKKCRMLAIKCVYKRLKPGGRFVAEMGGKGNVQQLIAATKQYCESMAMTVQAETHGISLHWAEYASRLEAAGLGLHFASHFDRKTPLQDGGKAWPNGLPCLALHFLRGARKAKASTNIKRDNRHT